MSEKELVIESMKTRRREVLRKLVEYEAELKSLDYSITKLEKEIAIPEHYEQSKPT